MKKKKLSHDQYFDLRKYVEDHKEEFTSKTLTIAQLEKKCTDAVGISVSGSSIRQACEASGFVVKATRPFQNVNGAHRGTDAAGNDRIRVLGAVLAGMIREFGEEVPICLVELLKGNAVSVKDVKDEFEEMGRKERATV